MIQDGAKKVQFYSMKLLARTVRFQKTGPFHGVISARDRSGLRRLDRSTGLSAHETGPVFDDWTGLWDHVVLKHLFQTRHAVFEAAGKIR